MVLFAIGGMLSLELMNTAVERVVDLATKDYHPLAKQAKDIAAGAVFIYAALSVIIGAIIFLPKIIVYMS
jgi:undecaprenol kinase